jgi:hypothetical protein
MRFLLYLWMTSKATLNRGTDILFDEDHLHRRSLGKILQCIVLGAGQPGNSARATCSVSVYSRTETIPALTSSPAGRVTCRPPCPQARWCFRPPRSGSTT